MRILSVALAGLLASAVAASAADLVVFEAKGGGLKAGQKIKDDQPLLLKAGERVTLIASDGRTIKISGPYDKAPVTDAGSNEGTSLIAGLAALQTDKNARLTQAGVVREGQKADDPVPEPWLLNVGDRGAASITLNKNLCVREGTKMVLYRADPGFDEKVSLAPADRSWSATALWARGADRIEIPTLFPLKDRANYRVDIDNRQFSVTVHIVPKSVTDVPAQATWMARKECLPQAAVLAEQAK
jgi:hypothetical protein